MQYISNRGLWVTAALIVMMVMLALTGDVIGLSPEMLAGLGMVPLGIGNTVDAGEIKRLIVAQGDAWEQFKGANEKRLGSLEHDLNDVLKKMNRPGAGASSDWANSHAAGQPDMRKTFVMDIEGKRIPLLTKSDSLAPYFEKGSDEFDIGEYVRGAMLGSRKAASGPALVPEHLAAEIIDDVRRATVIVQAGAGTIPIEGPTTLARIIGDPTVHQHTEGADDVTESDIDLEPVTVNPKMLVALVPLTQEVVSDSPNLNAVLNLSLAAAFALKVDALSLATILADTNIPTSATGQDPADWAKVLAAVGAAMGADQPLPNALVGNTADFIARASQLAATAGSWLGKPPVLANMGEYPTTGVAAGTAILGGFGQAFAIAMRQSLSLEVIRWNKPGKATHMLVAHMRADGVVLQPKRLFIQQKTVV